MAEPSPPAQRRRLSWKKRLAFALVPVALLLASWEVFCRAFPVRTDFPLRELPWLEADPELYWRLKPTREGPQATNELGLRDSPFRRDAQVKLLLLGDSVAYGYDVADLRQCFPFLLEAELNRDRAGQPYELINAAVPGYSVLQETRTLELRGPALAPHAVVLQFCLNDVFERYLALAEHGGNRRFYGVDTTQAIRGVHGFLFRHSRGYERLIRWRQGRARRKSLLNAGNLSREPLTPELEEGWRTTFQELDQLRALCAQRQLPLLVLIPPYRHQLLAPTLTRQPQDRLIAYLEAHTIPFVDLLPPLLAARRTGQVPLFLEDGVHLTPLGHSVVAAALASALEPFLRQHGLWAKDQ